MDRSFSLFSPAIDERRQQLHRFIPIARGREPLNVIEPVEFSGEEYLNDDDAGWLTRFEPVLKRTPGVYIWHRNDTVRCPGHTNKGCWPRIRTGSHHSITKDTVLPTDGFVFYPCNFPILRARNRLDSLLQSTFRTTSGRHRLVFALPPQNWPMGSQTAAVIGQKDACLHGVTSASHRAVAS